MNSNAFSHRIVDSKGLTVVGLNGNRDSQYEIADKVKRKFSKINNLSIRYSFQVVWSINHKKGLYNTFLGFVVEAVDRLHDEFEVCRISPHKYVTFKFSGQVVSYIKFLESVDNTWFPNSKYEHHPQDCLYIHFSKGNYEVINRDLPKDKHTITGEIWVPIKEK